MLKEFENWLLEQNYKPTTALDYQGRIGRLCRAEKITLHLLRVSDNYDRNLLNKYLTDKNIFDVPTYHYEYYHLIKDKFNDLPIEKQNIILEYIENGPEDEYYEKDDEVLTSKRKKDGWILHKLTPIRNLLSQDIIEKYKDINHNK